MHPKSEAAITACKSLPEDPIGLHDAQVPDVLHALLSDPEFGVGDMPAIMVEQLGRPQSEADAMQAAIDGARASVAAFKAQVDALNAILDG